MSRPKTCVVTGYVPIANHTRSPQEYFDLGQRLGHSLGDQLLQCYYERIPDCWLTKFLEKLPPMEPPLAWAKGDNPKKNSLEYHVVQHQKIEWLWRAANFNQEPDTFIWMDYGIFSQPGFNADSLQAFLKRIRKNDFALPGCWAPVPDPMPEYPCWRFCGSLMIVPRHAIKPLDEIFKAATRTFVRATKKVTFEVNMLATCESMLKKAAGLRWYPADHNISMLENYR